MENVTTNINTTVENRQPNNQETFDMLKSLGYKEPEIRHALLALNRLRIPQISRRAGITRQTMYSTVDGIRKNLPAMKGFSVAVGMPATKVFSDLLQFE